MGPSVQTNCELTRLYFVTLLASAGSKITRWMRRRSDLPCRNGGKNGKNAANNERIAHIYQVCLASLGLGRSEQARCDVDSLSACKRRRLHHVSARLWRRHAAESMRYLLVDVSTYVITNCGSLQYELMKYLPSPVRGRVRTVWRRGHLRTRASYSVTSCARDI